MATGWSPYGRCCPVNGCREGVGNESHGLRMVRVIPTASRMPELHVFKMFLGSCPVG